MSQIALNTRAVVSENSEDYLLVMRVNGEVHYYASTADFAESAVPVLQDTIVQWRAQDEAKNNRHHHQNRQSKQEPDPPATQD